MNFAIIPFDEQPEDFMDRVKAIDPNLIFHNHLVFTLSGLTVIQGISQNK